MAWIHSAGGRAELDRLIWPPARISSPEAFPHANVRPMALGAVDGPPLTASVTPDSPPSHAVTGLESPLTEFAPAVVAVAERHNLRHLVQPLSRRRFTNPFDLGLVLGRSGFVGQPGPCLSTCAAPPWVPYSSARVLHRIAPMGVCLLV